MAKIYGIDVSEHNGTINWSQVKAAGYSFAIIRSSYRFATDSEFTKNISGAIAAGLPVGVYHFSYALNVEQAKQEADLVLSLIKPYKISLPVFFDFEYDTIYKASLKGVTLGKTDFNNHAVAFLERIKAAGYTPGIYYNLDYYRNMIDANRTSGYVQWYAQYASSASISSYDIWQYSSSGTIPGHGNTKFDLNIMTENTWNKLKGGNSTMTTDTAIKKVLDLANNEVGYLEKATNSSLYDKTANAGSNNYTKYAYEIWTKWPNYFNGNKNGYAWCASFVSWLFLTSFGEEATHKMLNTPSKSAAAGCPYAVQYFKNAGQYGSTPQIGAQIFFQSGGDITHTGIVYAFDATYVYTIEGNTSGASGVVANGGGVCKKSYKRTYSGIHGYGYPDWSVVANTYEEGWQQDNYGWWYQYSDGTYPKSTWKEINSKWYYFNEKGYMLQDTSFEADGYLYTFDHNGHVTRTEIEEDDNMTQEKFNSMMDEYLKELAAKDPSNWSKGARDWAENAGYIQGDEKGRKMYKKFLTREEMATLLMRFAEANGLH